MGTRVGFVGAGAMGLPMARRLLDQGHAVTVYARTPAKVVSLLDSGATLAASPAEAAAGSVVVFGCLRDEQAIVDVYVGERGLLGAVGPGQTLVEHGTIAPDLARSLAERAAERGAAFLDVPVTGGPQRAREGSLTGLAGGSADRLAAVLPLLRAYCGEVFHVGPVGGGLELKLVNQLLVSVHIAAAAEAAALIARLGLDPAPTKQALMSGWAASTMLDYCIPAALTADATASAATIGGMAEVQGLVADLATSSELSLPVFAAAQNLFTARVAAGAAGADLSQVARAYDPSLTTKAS